uniref:Ig-like domain-containing protein n=1 Tax=Scleropages formosus TaxID=113540 RepID=A0A8C9VKA9_SCLFO
GQTLTQSEAAVKKPGESHRLTCTFLDSFMSGLSLSYLHWIRQSPGIGLQWIGCIGSGTGTVFSESLNGQFSITKDSSTNTLYQWHTILPYTKLLSPEGPTVRTQCPVSSCVSTGAQTALTSVFALSPCCSRGNAELLSLGCLASGYFPADSVTFKWMDADGKLVSDFLLYPSVKSDTHTHTHKQIHPINCLDFD